MRVIVQAGHWRPEGGGGGAPGEALWAFDLTQVLGAKLESAGVEVVRVGDWLGHAPPAEVRQDADLMVALHYDAAVYGAGRNSGCFADRAALDPVGADSDRAVALWQTLYPAATGIPLREARRNVRTSYYYAFVATSPRTPGILLEHGCGAPVGTGGYPPGDDAAFLHDQLETVAALDAQAILAFLDAAAPQPDPSDEVAVLRAALAEANAIKQAFEGLLRALEARRRLKRGTTDRLLWEARGY